MEHKPCTCDACLEKLIVLSWYEQGGLEIVTEDR